MKVGSYKGVLYSTILLLTNNSIDINRSPMRRYFQFIDELANIPASTIGHNGQDATNENSTTLIFIELSLPQVTRHPFTRAYYYSNSIDINRSSI